MRLTKQVLSAGAVPLWIVGGPGQDELYGERGEDYLDGGAGNDYVDGRGGCETIS